MKALFSRLTIAALICVVQCQSRGHGRKPMQMATRRQHRAEVMSGKEALAVAMITLMQVQDLFEKHRWADISAYHDLSVKLPGRKQLHDGDYATSETLRKHPWIVLQIPPLLPKIEIGMTSNKSYRRLKYAAKTPPVPSPAPPPKTARRRLPIRRI